MNYETYICDCGCNLKFDVCSAGLDIYVGEGYLITERPMTEYCWNDFIPSNKFLTWNELRNYIIKEYNNESKCLPLLHLYNMYIERANNFPLNAILHYECAF